MTQYGDSHEEPLQEAARDAELAATEDTKREDSASDSAIPQAAAFAWDPAYANSFTLRKHQVAAVLAVLEALDSGPIGGKYRVEIAAGGGKTAVIADVISERVRAGWRVLVVSKDWNIIRQIASDLCRRHAGASDWISYVGPTSAQEQFTGLLEGTGGTAVLTTIQSWYRRRKRAFAVEDFDLVVIDEVHWGEAGTLYRALERRYGKSCRFVGFTGTARSWTAYELVGPQTTTRDLLDGKLLAEPVVFTVNTGVEWYARRTSAVGDFTARSLIELGQLTPRNELIVSLCVAYAKHFGKTLIFACGIDHTELLARELRAAGLSAYAYHSRLDSKVRSERLDAFRSGRIHFLVNVTALATGVDVPDIQTVVLARPTLSDILHAQMVARGARLAEGKTSFNLVDLADSVGHFGSLVVRPSGFLGSAILPSLRGPALHAHSFTRSIVRPFPRMDGYEVLEGIPVSDAQTFGIEFEIAPLSGETLSPARFAKIAEELRGALAGAAPTASHICLTHSDDGQDDSVWNIEPDPSCGIEITTRILVGIPGFIEVVDGLAAIGHVIKKHELGVNVRTGTHVHLGWRFDADELRWMLNVIAYYEPAILSIVAPSRAENEYTTPLNWELDEILEPRSEAQWQAFADKARYRSINLQGLFNERGTLEIRTHSGTLEAPKILAWVGLFQTLCAEAWDPPAQPGSALEQLDTWPLAGGERGDVVALAEFLRCRQPFTDRLRRRRDHVVERSWSQVAPHLVTQVRPTWR